MNVDIDTEQLIEEIALRPEIWDYSSPDYKLRKERNKSWDEICHVLFEDFGNYTSERKGEFYRLLQRKWKSLRDCYVREKNQSKQLGRRRYRRRYVFTKNLSFLETIVKPESAANETIDNYTIEVDDNSILSKHHTPQLHIERLEPSPSSSDRGFNENDMSNMCNLSPPRKFSVQSPLEDDEDRLFLLSLLKDLKKVPEDYKLEAKSELLTVLSKWKRSVVELNVEEMLKCNCQCKNEIK